MASAPQGCLGIGVNGVPMARRSLVFVGVVNGGIFSALVAHVCLNALSPIGLAGSYRVHTHPTLVPAACVAVLCCGFTVLVLLGHALDCRRTGTIRAAARAFASIHLARSVAAVAAAGCTTLWCMESIEQLAGDGQLDGMLSQPPHCSSVCAAAPAGSPRWVRSSFGSWSYGCP